MHFRRTAIACSLLLLAGAATDAQYYQTDFPAEEFESRHAKPFERIGEDAVAAAVDRQLRVREKNLYLRYEDTVVVTETGVENFTDFLPMELDDMEKLVVEKGIVQKVPPVPASAIPRGTGSKR